METALWITAIGTAVLFGSLGCLVGLMYLLTSSWLFPQKARVALRARRGKGKRRFRKAVAAEQFAAAAAEAQLDEMEQERRRRAVVLAVAIACAEATRTELILLPEIPSDWRLLYRTRRLESGCPPRRGRS